MKKFKSAIQYMDERPIDLEKYNNIPIFDHEKIDKLREGLPKITHYIGVDKAETEGSYCLGMHVGNSTSILLAKTIKNRKKFDKEVRVLARIFNATVIEEV